MRRYLFVVISLLSLAIVVCGQQPTSTDPLVYENTTTVNGVGPGYWPTKGTGLTLNISAGRVRCGSTMINYAGGTLTLSDNTTNYVYLDSSSSCGVGSNTTGYTSTLVAIATVITSGGTITNIADDRTVGMGITNPSSGSGVVNAGTANQIAWYPSSTAAVSGNSRLTDDGTTLAYSGTGFNLGSSGASLGTFTDQSGTPSSTPSSGKSFVYTKTGFLCTKDSSATEHCVGSSGGTVTNIATSGPITGGPITNTGTLGFAGTDVNSSGNVVATHLSSPLPVAQGGTGTTIPGLVAGTGIGVSGSWPNQTVSNTGSSISSFTANSGTVFAGPTAIPNTNYTLIQTCYGSATSVSAVTATCTQPITHGDALVLYTYNDDTGATSRISSISDPASDTFTTDYDSGAVPPVYYGSSRVAHIFAAAGGNTAITANYTSSASNLAIVVVEYQGLLSSDATQECDGNSPLSCAVTTTAVNDLVLTFAQACCSATVQTNNNTAVFTTQLSLTGLAGSRFMVMDAPASTIGTYTAVEADNGVRTKLMVSLAFKTSALLSGSAAFRKLNLYDISSVFLQGTGGKFLTAGTIAAGAGNILCTDAGGAATTTCPAASVSQINGSTIPASQPCVGTNSSSQIVSGTCSGGGGGGGSLVLLESHTASNSASLIFNAWLSASYDEYLIEFVNVLPQTSSTNLLMTFSSDSGTTYDTTAAHYFTRRSFFYGTGSTGQASDSALVGHIVAGNVINTAANGGIVGSLKLFSPSSTTITRFLLGNMQDYDNTASSYFSTDYMGAYSNSGFAINAFKMAWTSGNIVSGTVRVYGIAH